MNQDFTCHQPDLRIELLHRLAHTVLIIAGALSIPTIDYLPFAFFCLLCPVITVFCGFTGIGIQKKKESSIAKELREV